MRIIRSVQATRFRHIGVLLVLFLLGMMAMRFAASYVSSVAGGAGIFDLNFGNDGIYVHDNLLALGDAGRNVYLYTFLPIDTIYAAIYAVFYVYTLAFFLRCTVPNWWNHTRWLVLLPVLGAICDWLENMCFAFMLIQPSTSVNPLLVTSTSLLTKAKFVLVYLSLSIVLGLVLGWLVCCARVKRRRE